jgi:hypothetical protein
MAAIAWGQAPLQTRAVQIEAAESGTVFRKGKEGSADVVHEAGKCAFFRV